MNNIQMITMLKTNTSFIFKHSYKMKTWQFKSFIQRQ